MRQWLAKQFSGPAVTTFADGISNNFNKYKGYLSYMQTLSLETAQESELENLGAIIGFIRPLVPNSVILDKLLRFSDISLFPSTSEVGFSSLSKSSFKLLFSPVLYFSPTLLFNAGDMKEGGNFSSLTPLDSNKMPINQYRIALKGVALLKWNKYSMFSIDTVCSYFSPSYVISYTANHDILIMFTDISISNLYIVTLIFNTFFVAMPKIFCGRS